VTVARPAAELDPRFGLPLLEVEAEVRAAAGERAHPDGAHAGDGRLVRAELRRRARVRQVEGHAVGALEEVAVRADERAGQTHGERGRRRDGFDDDARGRRFFGRRVERNRRRAQRLASATRLAA
jgi:hypothetical protein